MVGTSVYGRIKHSLFTEKNGDLSDRLNYRYTVLICLLCSGVIGYKQFFDHPIRCVTPDDKSSSWVKAVNDLCWTSGGHVWTFSSPKDGNRGKGTEMLNNFRWIPAWLVLQALSFYLPWIFWRTLSSMTGLFL